MNRFSAVPSVRVRFISGNGHLRLPVAGNGDLPPLVLISCLFLVAICGCQTMESRRIQGRADDFMRQGEYAAAYEAYSELATADPDRAEGYEGKGRALLELERVDEAVAELTRALDIDSELTSALYFRGIAYARSARPDMAVADLSSALEKDPKQPMVHVARGTVFLNTGRYESAIADFDAAARFEETKRYSSIYLYLGYCHEKIGNNKEALAAYQKFLIYADPDDSRLKMARESVKRVSR